MGKILEMEPADLEQINAAYQWMEKERTENGEDVLKSTCSTITDFYVPFDMHISFFYDADRDKIFVRTYIYASGYVTYEELSDPAKIVNESDDSRTIAWMLLRTGVFLSNR